MVRAVDIPSGTMLKAYQAQEGCYTDCYAVDVAGAPDIERFIRIFFDTSIFRLERRILALSGLEATHADDVDALARGHRSRFAAWRLEGKTADELMLRFERPSGRTWLHVADVPDQSGQARLFFGSALLPGARDNDKRPTIGWSLHAFLPFHRLYARMLLRAAAADWRRGKK